MLKVIGVFLFSLCVFFPSTQKVFGSTVVDNSVTVHTTWTQSGSPYVVQNDVTVNAGVTLTIEPGVVVKFSDGSSLSVRGIVNAFGTDTEPIYFTSLSDDAHGGDTNEDGTDSTPSRYDDWGIGVYGATAQLSVSHASIEYSNDGLYVNRGILNLASVSFHEAGEGISSNAGRAVLNSVSLRNIDGDALGVYGASVVEVTDSIVENVDSKNLTPAFRPGLSGTMVGNVTHHQEVT